jgi:EF hand
VLQPGETVAPQQILTACPPEVAALLAAQDSEAIVAAVPAVRSWENDQRIAAGALEVTAYDRNGDGHVDPDLQEGYNLAQASLRRSQKQAAVRRLFERFDLDKDGVLSAAESAPVLDNYRHPGDISSNESWGRSFRADILTMDGGDGWRDDGEIRVGMVLRLLGKHHPSSPERLTPSSFE